MKALLIAELASPEAVSVPLVAWSHAMAIRRRCDALLVTQIRHRDVFLRHGLREEEDFIAIDSEPVARPLWKFSRLVRGGSGKGWTTGMAISLPAYLFFERLVRRRLGDRLRRGEFDVVHRLSPLSPTMPSPLASHCRRWGVPFILGPLNGGVPWPKGYNDARIQEREWLSFVRGAYRLVPHARRTRTAATAIIAGSLDTLGQEPAAARRKAYYMPENGIDLDRFTSVRPPGRPIDPVRVIFVGRLVPYKGCDILLEAVAPLLASGRARLTIVGDGPQRPQLEALVSKGTLDHAVDFRGWVDHSEVGPLIAASDLFAFPSIREFGGAVAIEAMAAGVAPMVVAYGGLGESVTDDVGYSIPLGSRAELVERFRAALEHAASRPEELDRKGQEGRRLVETHYAWDAKAAFTERVYRAVVDGADCPRQQLPLSPENQRRLETAVRG